MEVRPFRGLRYDPARLSTSPVADVTAPPYVVISPAEHRRLLERSAYNVTRLTLGSTPGEASDHAARGRLFRAWIDEGVLAADATPCFYVYAIDYTVPVSGRAARMLGLIALGRLHGFDEGVVLPHEQTFPKVVADRERLLEATGANLESIFLLYSDPDLVLDRLLEAAASGDAAVRVEARPGEFHALYPISDPGVVEDLRRLMASQRPIIADGHHRYTTSLRFSRDAGRDLPGSGWQMMTFANLHSDGLAILATHRLVKLRGGTPAAALAMLRERLTAATEEDWDLKVETGAASLALRFPASLRAGRSGVGKTSYALLHDVVLGDWLRDGEEPDIRYFKEGTGEDEALRGGEGDLLFRMRPVGRREFQTVVEGGEVFPHKTTYFYPKLWSGLVMWQLVEPPAAP